jgi:beta-phosphoglucomutase-like phosphatase (HAD superfamily)
MPSRSIAKRRDVPLELIGMTSGHSLMIFDVEGTLVDSTGLTLRCWQETLDSFGFEFPLTTLQRHSGQDPHDMLHELLPGPHVTRVLGHIIEMQGKRRTCGRYSSAPNAREGASPWPRAHPPTSSITTFPC